MTLITGALPAQYGLHTAGMSRHYHQERCGTAGRQHRRLWRQPADLFGNFFEYGGVKDNTEYFADRPLLLQNGLGLENPDQSASTPFHDHTYLGRFFSYTSTLLDPWNRHQHDHRHVGAALPNSRQSRTADVNQPGGFSGSAARLSAFGMTTATRSTSTKTSMRPMRSGSWPGSIRRAMSMPSSHISRATAACISFPMCRTTCCSTMSRPTYCEPRCLNGVQGDGAYKVTNVHTIRAGFFASGEQTQVQESDHGGSRSMPPAKRSITRPTFATASTNSAGSSAATFRTNGS